MLDIQRALLCPLQVNSSGAAARDGRLQVGMRILEVSNHSLLGMTHTEAVRVLRAVGDTLVMLVCDGFDPQTVAGVEVRAGDAWRVSGWIHALERTWFSS